MTSIISVSYFRASRDVPLPYETSPHVTFSPQPVQLDGQQGSADSSNHNVVADVHAEDYQRAHPASAPLPSTDPASGPASGAVGPPGGSIFTSTTLVPTTTAASTTLAPTTTADTPDLEAAHLSPPHRPISTATATTNYSTTTATSGSTSTTTPATHPRRPHIRRQRRSSLFRAPDPAPLLRSMSRIGTLVQAAHAQDFERRRKPGLDGPGGRDGGRGDYQGGVGGPGSGHVGPAGSDDEDDEDTDVEDVGMGEGEGSRSGSSAGDGDAVEGRVQEEVREVGELVGAAERREETTARQTRRR